MVAASGSDLVVRIAGESSSLRATMREGAELTRQFMTEQERNAVQLKRLGELYDRGAISAETMSRGVAKITEAENAAGRAALIAEEQQYNEIRKAMAEERRLAAEREMKADAERAQRAVQMNEMMTRSYESAMERRMARVVASQMEAQAAERVTGATKMNVFAVQQLAFGMQDAATVVGTMGFAGAFRAASNNLIQFASLISPLHGTIAALAGTGLALLIDNLFKTEKQAHKTHSAIEGLTDGFEKLAARVDSMPSAMSAARSKLAGDERATKSDDIRSRIGELEAESRDYREAAERRNAVIQQSETRLKQIQEEREGLRKNKPKGWSEEVDAINEEEKKLQEFIRKQKNARLRDNLEADSLERRRDKMKGRLPEADSRDIDEAFQRQQDAWEQNQEAMRKEAEQIERSLQTPADKMEEEIDRLETLRNAGVLNVDTFEAAVARARDEFDEAMNRADPLNRKAEALMQRVQTPLERLDQQREDAQKLFGAGYIDEESFNREMERIADEEEKLGKKRGERGQEDNKALERGSTEAFRAIVQAQRDSQENTQKQMLGVQQKQENLQGQMVAALERANQIAENQTFTVVENIA